jgi:hypothetical protein
MGGRGESGIAASASTAPGNPEGVSFAEHLTQDLARGSVMHHRTGWHRQIDIRRGGTGLGLPFAVLAPLSLPDGAIPVIEQGGQVGIAFDEDAAAVPAIAAVRSALRLVFEPGEGAGSRTTGSPHHSHQRAIDQHHCPGDHPSRTVRHSCFTFFQ